MPENSMWRGLQVLLVLFLIGMIFYTTVEKLTPIDAFYFSGATLTTLGFGDIVPRTDAGKIFTVIYSIMGIGTIFYLSGNLFALVAKKHFSSIPSGGIIRRKKKKR